MDKDPVAGGSAEAVKNELMIVREKRVDDCNDEGAANVSLRIAINAQLNPSGGVGGIQTVLIGLVRP